MSLKDKVIFISGGSRGIGLAMVKKAAQDGAKVAIAAKTAEPHPKLPFFVHELYDPLAIKTLRFLKKVLFSFPILQH